MLRRTFNVTCRTYFLIFFCPSSSRLHRLEASVARHFGLLSNAGIAVPVSPPPVEQSNRSDLPFVSRLQRESFVARVVFYLDRCVRTTMPSTAHRTARPNVVPRRTCGYTHASPDERRREGLKGSSRTSVLRTCDAQLSALIFHWDQRLRDRVQWRIRAGN